MFGKIIATGSYLPEKELSNDELSKYVDTSDEWIKERTGVLKRHIMTGETTSDMAVMAAGDALKKGNVNPREIDLIIVSSASSDLILPNTACFVQEHINAQRAVCFDINSACAGFIMAYNTAQTYINSGLAETALIIGAEGLSKLVDWNDRTTCILFGDGAGAVVLKKDSKAKFNTVMHANGKQGKTLTCMSSYADRENMFSKDTREINSESYRKNMTRYINMDGQEIFRFAVKEIPKCINELIEKMEIKKECIDWFILHQANERILKLIAKKLDVSMDKVPMNISECANTSSACIPILLDELMESGKLKEDDRVIMSGFGAGLTWAATYLQI